MATAPAPGALEAKMASLETQLANVKAQAEADAVNAEHLSQAMEQRYATLAAGSVRLGELRLQGRVRVCRVEGKRRASVGEVDGSRPSIARERETTRRDAFRELKKKSFSARPDTRPSVSAEGFRGEPRAICRAPSGGPRRRRAARRRRPARWRWPWTWRARRSSPRARLSGRRALPQPAREGREGLGRQI